MTTDQARPFERLVALLLPPGPARDEAAALVLRACPAGEGPASLRAAVESCGRLSGRSFPMIPSVIPARGSQQALAGSFSDLPFEERAVLVLRDGMGLPWAEAAGASGLDEEAFAEKLGRARLRAAAGSARGVHSLGNLSRFMDQILQGESLARIREHLETCANCHEAYGAMSRGTLTARALRPTVPETAWAGAALQALDERDRFQAQRRQKRNTLLAFPFDPPLGLYINGAIAALVLLTAVMGRTGLSRVLGWLSPASKPEAGLLDGVTILGGSRGR